MPSSFPLPPPTVDDWNTFSNTLFVGAQSGPCPEPATGLQTEARLVGTSDWSFPVDIDCDDAGTIVMCTLGLTYEVRARWHDSMSAPLSDWSVFKTQVCMA